MTRGRKVRHIAAALLALAIAGSALSGAQAETADDVTRTWSHGSVVLPAHVSSTRTFVVKELPLDRITARGLPAIVLIHGSDGVSPGFLTRAAAFSDGGFVVFVPDSFKRPGRAMNCDPKTLVCGKWPEVYRHRSEEIAYAASAVARMPFVDPARVVLVGHSEGGIAAAHYAGRAFAGIVISGWHCGPSTRGRDKYLGDFGGIKSPPDVPILSIYSQRDPWFANGGGLNGDCSRYFAGRTNAQAILDPGDVHYLLSRPDMTQAVIAFARSVTGAR